MSADLQTQHDAVWERLKLSLLEMPRRRYASLGPLERELAVAECWLSAALEVNDAYAQQRQIREEFRRDFRLEGEDVAKLYRYGVWRHYRAAERVWSSDPGNRAADKIWTEAIRLGAKAGESPKLPAEAEQAIRDRPRRPHVEPLEDAQMPSHWPEMVVSVDGGQALPSWTRWVAVYLHGVRQRRAAGDAPKEPQR